MTLSHRSLLLRLARRPSPPFLVDSCNLITRFHTFFSSFFFWLHCLLRAFSRGGEWDVVHGTFFLHCCAAGIKGTMTREATEEERSRKREENKKREEARQNVTRESPGKVYKYKVERRMS